MFGDGIVRTLGDIGFAAWCLCGAALFLVPMLLNAYEAPKAIASLIAALETPLVAHNSEALIYQSLFWLCSGGFFLWLATLAVERVTGKR